MGRPFFSWVIQSAELDELISQVLEDEFKLSSRPDIKLCVVLSPDLQLVLAKRSLEKPDGQI